MNTVAKIINLLNPFWFLDRSVCISGTRMRVVGRTVVLVDLENATGVSDRWPKSDGGHPIGHSEGMLATRATPESPYSPFFESPPPDNYPRRPSGPRYRSTLPDVHYNLGSALLREACTKEASKEFATAVQLDPSFDAAHHNLALTLVRMGHAEESIPEYKLAVRSMNTSAIAHHNFSVALAAAREVEEAINEEDRALALDTRYRPAKEHRDMLKLIMAKQTAPRSE